MIRYVVVVSVLTVLLPSASSLAVTPKQKMETCQFGADDQRLEGAARKAFMAKCMANKNDPRGSGAGAQPASGMPPPKQ
jgi:hypothetical protein